MENVEWIRGPLNAKLNGSVLNVDEQRLVDLCSEASQKIKFPTVSLTGF
jgi:hypothetical protein